MRVHATLAAAAVLFGAWALPAWADEGEGNGGEAPSEAQQEAADDDKADARWLVVHAGWIHTVTGPVLRDASILAKGRQIVALGHGLDVPEGAEVLDARRFHVYPGLVALDSMGLVGSPAEDSTDVFGLNLVLGLATGITTVGSGGEVVKLTYGTLEGHVLGQRAVFTLPWGSPDGRRKLIAELDKVREHRRKQENAAAAKARGEDVKDVPALQGRLGQLAKLLEGSLVAEASAATRRDLTELAEVALRYGFRVRVRGAIEAWTVAPLLGRAGFEVVVVPRARRAADPRSSLETGWTIENAARLHEAGVPLAIMSANNGIGTWGLAGQDLFTLPLEAAFAIRGGLPEDAALAALTMGPARMLGVDHRVGSIEVGKDCDLVITGGDLLHYRTLPEWTVVNGRIAYDKAKEGLLDHVRPRDQAEGNLDVPQLWPRAWEDPQPDGRGK